MSYNYIHTKLWLKSFGWIKSDGWWVVSDANSTKDFKKILGWELERSQWSEGASTNVMLDWDGDISDLFVDIEELKRALDNVGLAAMGEGWVPLRNLSHEEQFLIMFHLPEYQDMIKR